MSLVIIPAIALYVICVVALPIFMFRWARRRKWATRRRWTAAVAGLLILTVPVFWDWAPTVWLHSHYCHSYAGLTVNKAPRQWSDENPGIVETLVRPKILSQTGSWPDFAIDLNDRLRREVRSIKKPLSLSEDRELIVDKKTGEVLVQLIDFSTSQSGSSIDSFRDIKVWMRRESCDRSSSRRRFGALSQQFEDLGSGK
jgi:hypothetical protein